MSDTTKPAEASGPLLIRVDAGEAIGTGHVMRMIALAQAWKEMGGSTVFVVAMELGVLEDRLNAEGFAVHCLKAEPGSLDDAGQTLEHARICGSKWIVFDGYHFNTPYQQALRPDGQCLLCVDDAGYAGVFEADLILNQNLSANAELYRNRPETTRLLLGPEYALLRREFSEWRDWTRCNPDPARNVLLTLGGSDPDNVSLMILKSLKRMTLSDCKVRILIGASNPHGKSLQREAADLGDCCEIIVNSSRMPEQMEWADVTVAAGGSTCWELAMMGMPMVLVILADNQKGVSEALAASGAAVNLGWHDEIQEEALANELSSLLGDLKRRQQMSDCGRKLVDGYGADRVAKLLI